MTLLERAERVMIDVNLHAGSHGLQCSRIAAEFSALIEECAKVAENVLEAIDRRNEVAAAIRRLKSDQRST